MKISRLLALVLTLVGANAPAWGNCYSVYNEKGSLIFQSVYPPVDLDKPVAEAIQRRFPGAVLVFVPLPLGHECQRVDASKKSLALEDQDTRPW